MPRLLIAQVLAALAVSGFFIVREGVGAGAGAAYGGGISLANGLLLCWRHQRGVKRPHADVQRHLRSLVISAVERFVVVVLLFVIGFGVLMLAPLPLLIGFVAGQTALLLTGSGIRNY